MQLKMYQQPESVEFVAVEEAERGLFRERFSVRPRPPFYPRPVEVTPSVFCRLFPR